MNLINILFYSSNTSLIVTSDPSVADPSVADPSAAIDMFDTNFINSVYEGSTGYPVRNPFSEWKFDYNGTYLKLVVLTDINTTTWPGYATIQIIIDGVYYQTLDFSVTDTQELTLPAGQKEIRLIEGALAGPFIEKISNDVINDDFEDWADPTVPDGWAKNGTHDASNYTEQDPALNGLRLVSSGTNISIGSPQVLDVSTTYKITIDVSTITGGIIIDDSGTQVANIQSAGIYEYSWEAENNRLYIKRGASPCDAYIRNFTIQDTSIILNDASVSGTYLTEIWVDEDEFTKIDEPSTNEKIVFLGDGITSGFAPTNPQEGTYCRRFDSSLNKNVGVIGWGGATLEDMASTTTLRDNTIEDIQTLFSFTINEKKLVILLGTNDWVEENTPEDIDTWYKDLIDTLNVADPSIKMTCISPIVRNSSDTNLDLIRTNIEVMCSSNGINRPFAHYLKGKNILTYPEDFHDTIHPNELGHSKLYKEVETSIIPLWDVPYPDNSRQYKWQEMPDASYNYTTNNKINEEWLFNTPTEFNPEIINGEGLRLRWDPSINVSGYPSWLQVRSEIREYGYADSDYPQSVVPALNSTSVYCLRFKLDNVQDPLVGTFTIFQRFRDDLDKPDLGISLVEPGQFTDISVNTVAVHADGSTGGPYPGWTTPNTYLQPENDLVVIMENKTGGSYKVSLNGVTLVEQTGDFPPDDDAVNPYTGPQFGVYNHGGETEYLQVTHRQYAKYEYVVKPNFDNINSIDPN